MAVTGAKPKPDGQKVTRHPLTTDWTDVPNVRYDGERPNPGRLPKVTLAWWEDVSTMPHCVDWTPQEWRFAVDTARVHAMAFGPKGRTTLISEVRTRESKMGTTADSLRDLRIRYVDVAEPVERREGDDQAIDFEAERRRRLMEAE